MRALTLILVWIELTTEFGNPFGNDF